MATLHALRSITTPPAARTTTPGPAATRLSATLAVVAAATCAAILFRPGVLSGPAAMNGSARGTALVALVVAVPVLALSLAATRRGSVRALPTWIGAVAYLLYNAFLLLFATPFDSLFLAYVAMGSLALWALLAVLRDVDAERFGRLFDPAVPARKVAAYVWVVVGLNALAWLAPVLRAMRASGPPAFLAGTGLATSPTYIEDLAFWLPAMAVGALWLWRRQGRGYVVVSAGLVLWVIESAGVAVDQWLGHAADPASPAASAAISPAFAALAVLGLVPLVAMLRHLPAAPPSRWASATGARPRLARTLVGLQWFVGAQAVFGGVRMIHDGFGMPADWLAGSGFSSWVLPGTALLVGVALPQFAASALLVLRHRWAVPVAAATGATLVLWVVVQLAVLQKYFFLQPVIALLGLAELALAASLSAGPRTNDPAPARGVDED